ncbi:histidinol-phosphate transaminase [Streptomyces gibsoniae]|uniref:Histidinol-phosphate aminotransferase n=1 Tax=Streptomyces gibsoniae TaxID=3075529 RepID=A0ABU2TU18_9ACTN|nr:histidinol-phosphate transaminase [Streptomyces sp. DSM 41699]MDT0464459.1 histidinol-phosphate transaminase [Streptomyces sp. DSM 41699]
MSLPRLRTVLDTMPSYQPSEGVYASERRPRLLSANESPHQPLSGITEAIARAGATVNRYPDPGCAALTRSLARTHGIDEDRIVVGAGSVALLQTLFQAIADPGAEVVHAWPSFELYPVLAELAGVTCVPVPLTDGTHDLRTMADRITPRTRLVVVCNPNNPTGTVADPDELARFIARIPPTCLVALDEAYFEYVRSPAVTNGLEYGLAHPNIVVLRTFSKAYGLAGLRVGYLVGDARVTRRLRKAGLAYAVSAVAQHAAVEALVLQEQLMRRVDDTVAERTRVREALLRDGWAIPASEANFLWLPLGEDAAAFGQWCTHQGIAVRAFPGEGVRVTVGSREDNDVFLTAAATWRTTRPWAVAPRARTEHGTGEE